MPYDHYFDSQTLEEQATLKYCHNSVEKTVDAVDHFHMLGVNKSILNLDGDTDKENNNELIKYSEQKILSQSLLINKLSNIAYLDDEFVSFCQAVLREAYTDDTSLSIAELRDIFSHFITQITPVDEEYFDTKPFDYANFQERIRHKLQKEGVLKDYYFVLMYSGLRKFATVIESYNESNNSSQIVEEFGNTTNNDTDKTEFTNYALIGGLARDNLDKLCKNNSLFTNSSSSEVQVLLKQYTPTYMLTDRFLQVVNELGVVIADKTDSTMEETVRYLSKSIDSNDSAQTVPEQIHSETTIPRGFKEFLDNTSLLHQKVLLFILYRMNINEG